MQKRLFLTVILMCFCVVFLSALDRFRMFHGVELVSGKYEKALELPMTVKPHFGLSLTLGQSAIKYDIGARMTYHNPIDKTGKTSNKLKLDYIDPFLKFRLGPILAGGTCMIDQTGSGKDPKPRFTAGIEIPFPLCYIAGEYITDFSKYKPDNTTNHSILISAGISF